MTDRSDDLYLPNAVIMRIIKEALPDASSGGSVMVSKEARSALSKAASSFVLCATSMAKRYCQNANRKTLAASDVLAALREMEFGHFEEQILEFLKAYREIAAAKKSSKKLISPDDNSETLDDPDEAF